ncbi:MAG: NAD(P)H-dependent oxidoreductase, partial [Bacteroidota bacterium]
MPNQTKTIVTVTGSAQDGSSNRRLLTAIAKLLPEQKFTFFDIRQLPLFQPDTTGDSLPETVIAWRQALEKANALIITTPAYLE